MRSLILCAFDQLDHSVYRHIAARLWKGTWDRCQHPALHGSKEWTVGDTDTAGAGAGRQPLSLSHLSRVIPVYLQNYPSSRHEENCLNRGNQNFANCAARAPGISSQSGL